MLASIIYINVIDGNIKNITHIAGIIVHENSNIGECIKGTNRKYLLFKSSISFGQCILNPYNIINPHKFIIITMNILIINVHI